MLQAMLLSLTDNRDLSPELLYGQRSGMDLFYGRRKTSPFKPLLRYIEMKLLSRTACLTLLVMLSVMPGVAQGEEKAGNPVVEMYVFDTGGDLPGFVALVMKAREISDKINPDGDTSLSVYTAVEAGPMTGQVTVAVEHPDLAKWGQSAQTVSASPEWQAIFKQARDKKYKLISRSLHVQVARDD